jgi:hypothetical protein
LYGSLDTNDTIALNSLSPFSSAHKYFENLVLLEFKGVAVTISLVKISNEISLSKINLSKIKVNKSSLKPVSSTMVS